MEDEEQAVQVQTITVVLKLTVPKRACTKHPSAVQSPKTAAGREL